MEGSDSDETASINARIVGAEGPREREDISERMDKGRKKVDSEPAAAVVPGREATDFSSSGSSGSSPPPRISVQTFCRTAS